MTDGIQYHEEQARKIREVHRKHDEMMAGVRALKQAAAEAEAQKKAEAAQARAAAADAKFVAQLRRRYMASDATATEAQFQKDLPELRRLHRLAAVAGQSTEDDRARVRFSRQYTG